MALGYFPPKRADGDMGTSELMPNGNPAFGWWPHTDNRKIASFRIRCLAIMDALSASGMDCRLYRPGDAAPDCLILSKRYDRKSLACAQDLKRKHGTRIVVDLCDNHFFNPRDLPEWRERGNQLRAAIASADIVIASTRALADVIHANCAPAGRIVVIGDAAELPSTPPISASPGRMLAEVRLALLHRKLGGTHGRTEQVRLLWFGNHGSPYADGGMGDLLEMRSVVEQLARQRSLSLTVISNNRSKYGKMVANWAVPNFYLPWHEATISRALMLHDIALLPISQNPFTSCKTNNRLVSAFLHGLAVAADAIPSYEAFRGAAVLDDWEKGLSELVTSPQARSDRVAKGKILAGEWSLTELALQWRNALLSAVGADSSDRAHAAPRPDEQQIA